MNTQTIGEDTGRLEQLWSNDFGNEYVTRNRNAWEERGAFWRGVLERHSIGSALEVGCNIGTNLRWLAQTLPHESLSGVDINQQALDEFAQIFPDVRTRLAPARRLPIADKSFDLAFTMGVLIHQSPETLPQVMSEIVRCANKFVLCGEYFSEEEVEIPYRGHRGALYKQDFGGLYSRLFPDLELIESGFLTQSDGFDDITYWIFKKH